MSRTLNKAERLRAERRGFEKLIEGQQDRLDRGVFDDDAREHVEQIIDECENKIIEIDEELGQDGVDRVLDDEREELDIDDDYATDKAAQRDDFSSAKQGNDYQRELQRELLHEYNRSLRVEAQVVEDLALEGITKKDIFEVVEEYDRLNEELWEMFGVE